MSPNSSKPEEVLEDILADLRLLLTTMPESTAAYTEAGLVFWEVAQKANTALNEVKAKLRAAVSEQEVTEDSVTFETPFAVSTVKFQDPALEIRPSKVPLLRQALGSDFEHYVEAYYRPLKQFRQKAIETEDSQLQALLLESVNETENTPRVSFRRK